MNMFLDTFATFGYIFLPMTLQRVGPGDLERPIRDFANHLQWHPYS